MAAHPSGASRAIDAVVAGGGVLGTCAALHLQRLGIQTTLVERGTVGSGTSAAGGGIVAPWAAGSSPYWGGEELALEHYATDFYAELADDGADIAYRRSGALWAASDPDSYAKFLEPLARHEGAEGETVSPPEVEQLTGGAIRREGTAGGVYYADGAQISASKVSRALADRFREIGGQVLENLPVTRVLVEGDRAIGIETGAGPLHADETILAAGAWSRALAGSAGVDLPLVPLVATRITTVAADIPECLPCLMLPEYSNLWARRDLATGGLVWGAHYEEPPRAALVGAPVPDSFDGLPGEAVETIGKVAGRAAAMFPAPADAAAGAIAHGAPCYTPDLRGLVGRVPGLASLSVTGGDCYAGITHGPGFGALLAGLLAGPTALCDAAPFDPRRFGEVSVGEVWDARTLANARSRFADHLSFPTAIGKYA